MGLEQDDGRERRARAPKMRFPKRDALPLVSDCYLSLARSCSFIIIIIIIIITICLSSKAPATVMLVLRPWQLGHLCASRCSLRLPRTESNNPTGSNKRM
mmetsp:Transcript_19913/g.75246  ORF Transcript_19913/g.75246 Transcript_19913/m.75246 type:complete len:100 (-) Transcript_19913:320-619(-)